MERRRRIVLFGNSMILGTLEISFRHNAQFEIFSLDNSVQPDMELDALNPDVVIFDIEAARPEAAFSLLERRSGLLLIGVGPDKNVAKVWSGRQLRELSTHDLVAAINEH